MLTRLNISIVDETLIDNLIKLRKELQYIKDTESISYSEIIAVLFEANHNPKHLAKFL